LILFFYFKFFFSNFSFHQTQITKTQNTLAAPF